ncbi:MAG: aconitate hydratase [Candidatus Hadarchaeales archaeon]
MATLLERIVRKHLVEGRPCPGEEVAIKVDQTLTQDATGTLAYLEFEALGLSRVRTELSVSYVDHNTLQTDFRNADDHRYLLSVAKRYGIYFSPPGNGICHQLHLERFASPGKTLLGSDSHTPTAGAIGCLGMGAGGLDVALAMAGLPYSFTYPEVLGFRLSGELPEWVSAKDLALEVLRRLGVRGGRGKALEYFGPGLRGLSVPERATVANLGTETGATTSLFPSDAITKHFLRAQGREEDWVYLPEEGGYEEVEEVELERLEPLVALPHSPGNVKPVREVEGEEIHQVVIGSCTNSSLRDLKVVAHILKGKKVAEGVDLLISPGSRQVVEHLVKSGEMRYLLQAGARILECACGPCIGMGGAPPSGAASLRTFNRNFEGRSGTPDARVFLVSPEVAAASALKGKLTDPRGMGKYPRVRMPGRFLSSGFFVRPLPQEEAEKVEVVRGPNIRPLPEFSPLPLVVEGKILLKVGDDVSTDHILPAGSEVLPLRSNIPELAKYTFSRLDPTFYQRAKQEGGGFVVGGENYGQGSSREHAALVLRYLGVRAVLAKSFARIHLDNLINFGILPLVLDSSQYERLKEGEMLRLETGDLRKVVVRWKEGEMVLSSLLSEKEGEMVRMGGKLAWARKILGRD